MDGSIQQTTTSNSHPTPIVGSLNQYRRVRSAWSKYGIEARIGWGMPPEWMKTCDYATNDEERNEIKAAWYSIIKKKPKRGWGFPPEFMRDEEPKKQRIHSSSGDVPNIDQTMSPPPPPPTDHHQHPPMSSSPTVDTDKPPITCRNHDNVDHRILHTVFASSEYGPTSSSASTFPTSSVSSTSTSAPSTPPDAYCDNNEVSGSTIALNMTSEQYVR